MQRSATLRARWTDARGTDWTSAVPVPADGVIRDARFLTAMRPAGRAEFFDPPLHGPSAVTLSVGPAHATLERRFVGHGVGMRRLGVKHDGVAGTLFTPPRPRGPAVLVLGGSEGGDSQQSVAALLASHGHPALSLAYFRAPGLPKRLTRIPLEYFARAARTLRRRSGAARVVVLGGSRGGEAALLVASTFPDLVHGAIGLVPNSTAWPSLEGADVPSWTYRGRAVPPLMPIRVERIGGPVLTIAGGLDTIWDSSAYVQQIEQRLDTHRFAFAHASKTYPEAGHRAGGVPYLPPPPDHAPYGGSPAADNAARADGWPRILRFLDALRNQHASGGRDARPSARRP